MRPRTVLVYSSRARSFSRSKCRCLPGVVAHLQPPGRTFREADRHDNHRHHHPHLASTCRIRRRPNVLAGFILRTALSPSTSSSYPFSSKRRLAAVRPLPAADAIVAPRFSRVTNAQRGARPLSVRSELWLFWPLGTKPHPTLLLRSPSKRVLNLEFSLCWNLLRSGQESIGNRSSTTR